MYYILNVLQMGKTHSTPANSGGKKSTFGRWPSVMAALPCLRWWETRCINCWRLLLAMPVLVQDAWSGWWELGAYLPLSFSTAFGMKTNFHGYSDNTNLSWPAIVETSLVLYQVQLKYLKDKIYWSHKTRTLKLKGHNAKIILRCTACQLSENGTVMKSAKSGKTTDEIGLQQILTFLSGDEMKCAPHNLSVNVTI